LGERFGLGTAERGENSTLVDKSRKTDHDEVVQSTHGHDGLVIRSGDVVSSDGDVLSLSRNGKRGDAQPQGLYSKEDAAIVLTDAEQQQVNKLKQKDAEVKAHEAAHLGASGGLARGGASYEYQKGPDGNKYAVGGEVSIDSSPVDGNPEATVTKAQQIRSAALAPANPSAQDYKVAAKASQMEAEARQQMEIGEQKTLGIQADGDLSESVEKDNKNDHQTIQYQVSSAVTKYSVQAQVQSLQTSFCATA